MNSYIAQSPSPVTPPVQSAGTSVNLGPVEIALILGGIGYIGREVWKEIQKNSDQQDSLADNLLKTLMTQAAEDRKIQIENTRHQSELQAEYMNKLDSSLDRLAEHMGMLTDQGRGNMESNYALAQQISETLKAVQEINQKVWTSLQQDSRDTAAVFSHLQRVLAGMDIRLTEVSKDVQALHIRLDKHGCPSSHEQ
jgi:galactose-1-phosphate uridylyltransferase